MSLVVALLCTACGLAPRAVKGGGTGPSDTARPTAPQLAKDVVDNLRVLVDDVKAVQDGGSEVRQGKARAG